MSLTQEPERSMDDQELMRSIANGQTSELGKLYERHKEKALALAIERDEEAAFILKDSALNLESAVAVSRVM